VGLIEGPIAPVECVTKPDICTRSTSCVTRGVWCDMKKAIDGVLEFTTLQDLVERQKCKEQTKQARIPGRLPIPRSN